MSFRVPNQYRVRAGQCPQAPQYESDDSFGNNGAFWIPPALPRRPLRLLCIASDGDGWEHCGYPPPAWEHVSVSTAARCPTWEEMCLIKSLFWDPEDLVLQLHPPESDYVNQHPYCLHLWRPIGLELPRPPALAVGIR